MLLPKGWPVFPLWWLFFPGVWELCFRFIYALENEHGTQKWRFEKIVFRFKQVIFSFHVNFEGCKTSETENRIRIRIEILEPAYLLPRLMTLALSIRACVFWFFCIQNPQPFQSNPCRKPWYLWLDISTSTWAKLSQITHAKHKPKNNHGAGCPSSFLSGFPENGFLADVSWKEHLSGQAGNKIPPITQ